MTEIVGKLAKMAVSLSEQSQASYILNLGEHSLEMVHQIGHHIELSSTGNIFCHACNRLTKKSFSGGYCYPCSKKLAQCDLCIVRPETCHFDQGTCREPEWGQQFCMQDHIVYLANSSGVKVGITRINQIPTRWIDQGASQALPIFKVKTRYQSGLIESALKKQVADKTDWRKMLKGSPDPVDLKEIKQHLIASCREDVEQVTERFGREAVTDLDSLSVDINYPVDRYPDKIKSLNFDKTPDIGGILQGIKGQYLILDTGVINLRKFTGYEIKVKVTS